MTIFERIKEIQASTPSCHPSREDDIKAMECIETLAIAIDELIKHQKKHEKKPSHNWK